MNIIINLPLTGMPPMISSIRNYIYTKFSDFDFEITIDFIVYSRRYIGTLEFEADQETLFLIKYNDLLNNNIIMLDYGL